MLAYVRSSDEALAEAQRFSYSNGKRGDGLLDKSLLANRITTNTCRPKRIYLRSGSAPTLATTGVEVHSAARTS